MSATTAPTTSPSPWANKYRGATVEDLDPPPALSTSPLSPISSALTAAYERDYTHLTVLDPSTKTLLGYVSAPHLQSLLQSHKLADQDPVSSAMVKFQRKGRAYRTITMETPLEELEEFFEGGGGGNGKQDFAVVTDPARRFVLGVVTRGDLERFVERRPA
ncbi:related to cystathionine beta-synthase [Ramularia collo-cygni]|uniref:Related to cystathionine beta-synthase n=1 Tax=Ramularia collo-cygni TaxID=112498 RepID=A0A2D3VC82_9PEZI|nr:related to cystathionine beta-synthase [Ramularia collo-cygni]CZT19229.1 related to cystathionine beta-synthase [Ramularia collo-cygni]